jgi:adenosylmethionine---8-amino-7-oxononanoate aminotransferase
LGAAQQAALDRLANHPALTGHRRCGTIAAVDFARGGEGYLSALGPWLARFFRERDLLVRPLGETVYVMPPYCIDADDLGRVWGAIGEAADAVVEGRAGD